MNEVSCKVFDLLLTPLEAKGVSVDRIVVGTSVPPMKLYNKKARIDWTDYVAIMRNVRLHFSDDEYIEVGRSYMRTPGLKFGFVVARLLFSAMDFYRWFNKPREGVGNQMFTCIVPSHRELSANQIEMDLTLPEGFEVCWDFFIITRGNLEELPKLLGLARAQVELTRIPRGGRFHIIVPTGTPLLTRIRALLHVAVHGARRRARAQGGARDAGRSVRGDRGGAQEARSPGDAAPHGAHAERPDAAGPRSRAHARYRRERARRGGQVHPGRDLAARHRERAGAERAVRNGGALAAALADARGARRRGDRRAGGDAAPG